jgi:hypothetical protein
MAAQEYFASFGGQPRPTNPTPYPPQYQPSPPPAVQVSSPPLDFRPTNLPYNGTMATYNPPPQQQQPQHLRPPYPDDQHGQYGISPPQPSQFLNQPPPQSQSSNYLMAPLGPQRSYSEPPDGRRLSLADTRYGSDRRSHSRHRSRSRSSSSSSSRSRSRSRSRPRRDRGRGRAHEKARRDRDTFLGAGGGGILGDLIFPGAGTLGGMLLGGLGGHEYARRRSRSEIPDRERPHLRKDHRSERDKRNGITVHSGWIER